jgi:hypothetical protein
VFLQTACREIFLAGCTLRQIDSPGGPPYLFLIADLPDAANVLASEFML